MGSGGQRAAALTSMVKKTVNTFSVTLMNAFPGVSLSGSSGSYIASMIENTTISVSESWPNHLRIERARVSCGSKKKTGRRSGVPFARRPQRAPADRAQCVFPLLLLCTLVAQLLSRLSSGFACAFDGWKAVSLR